MENHDKLMSTQDFKAWSQERIKHFEWVLEQDLSLAGRDPKRLSGAMRYAVLGGGKRLRPLLVYAAGALSKAPQGLLDRAALAVECIHSYSLVHDDMPAMDNDTLRRGQPTCHVRYGEAMAMLAGDALQTEAFSLLVTAPGDAKVVLAMLEVLARASGSMGMCGGQAIDLDNVGKTMDVPMLEKMQLMKTGALIEASLLMGAKAGQFNEWADLTKVGLIRYAQSIGLAFQVVDDILDCTANTQTLGKTAGKDNEQEKPTWVSLLGLEGAKEKAQKLTQDAFEGLELMSQDEAIDAAHLAPLRALVNFIISRDH